MTIRPATPADCSLIASLWNPIIRGPDVTFNTVERTADDLVVQLQRGARQNYPFIVAVEGDEILGFATYGQFRASIGYLHTMEHTIILAPAARGLGIGRKLMTAIEDHARENGVHSMFAGVSASNTAGIEFHAKVGYIKVARLPEVGFKFDRWIDLVLMQKML